MGTQRHVSVSLIFFFIGSLQFLAIVTGLPAEWESLGESAKKDENIKISLVRLKRDTGEEESAQSRGYQMKVSAFDSEYNENLVRPPVSIFSSDFKYQVVNGRNGEIKDYTPSLEEIKEIENGHFVNSQGAAVSVSQFEGSEVPKVRGIVGDLTITSNNENIHVATKRINIDKNNVDYIDLKRNITPGVVTRGTVVAQPEVFVVFDYTNYKTFNGNTRDIIDYLAVFFHAINNRFSTISDPKITFKISGIRAINSSAGEPFMENSKTPDGRGNDIDKALDGYAKWVYANRNTIPKHDLATVISGRDFQLRDSTGRYSNSVNGVAYLSSACWVDTVKAISLGTSVAEDMGGYYDGVFTLAHELAHNLGAPHDGSGGAASCSWNDGYIMSYNGWGTKNKFLFSPCSINLMKNFIRSSEGNCLKSIQNPNDVPISRDNPGDRLDMTALCRKYTGLTSAVVDSSRTPSDLCKTLTCRYPTPNKPPGWITTWYFNHPPGDNSACGNGGRCINGDCITTAG